MLHALVGIGIIAGLLAFAFGPKAARVFVGGVLACSALAVPAALVFVAVDLNRVSVVQQPKMIKQNTVTVSARDLAAIWQRIEEKDARR